MTVTKITEIGKMGVLWENIPEKLKIERRWVCWKFEQRGGKMTKVPYTPTGRRAKSNDSKTWYSFKECRTAVENGLFDGVGFQLDGSGIVGIDVDHCKDTAGNWSAAAADIIEELNSYTEISPSGDGIHIFVYGTKFGDRSKNAATGVEIYDTGRFLTVTGNLYRQNLNTVQERQDALNKVYFKYIEPLQEQKTPTEREKIASVAPLDDNAIIELLESGKAGGQKSGRGAELQAYWRGDYQLYTDDLSAADLSLCNALAFWTQKDMAQMDRIFRQSGLYMLPGRVEKWNAKHSSSGQTYGSMTISRAVAACNVVYSAHNLTGRFNNEPIVKQNFPVLKADGKPVTTHWKNLNFLLKRWGILLKYNEITHDIELYKGGKRQQLTRLASIATELRGEANAAGLGIGKADIYDLLTNIAEKNKYNPLTDYFEQCFSKWTAAGSQKIYFSRLCAAIKLEPLPAADEKFLYSLLRKWLLQAVKLAYNGGSIKPQSILVLQGPQGIGKSRFVSWLLPLPELVLTEQSIDPANKDSVIKCTSRALVEISEMGRSMRDKDLLKQFFTSSIDTYRAPYDRDTVSHPRRTSFIGTVNDDTFLIDRTGERRYFALPLIFIDWTQLDTLPQDILWGEIYAAAVVDGERYWLTPGETKTVNAANEKFNQLSDVEQGLIDLLNWEAPRENWQQRTATEIAGILFHNGGVYSAKVGRTLAAMSRNGKIDKPVTRHGTGAARYYLLPPLKTFGAFQQ